MNKLTIMLILIIMIIVGSVSYLYYREFTKPGEDDELRLLFLEGTLQNSLIPNTDFDNVLTVDHIFEKLRNGEHYFLISFVNFLETDHVNFRVTNHVGDIVSDPKVKAISSNEPTKVHFIVKSSDEEYNLHYENTSGNNLDLVRVELSL